MVDLSRNSQEVDETLSLWTPLKPGESIPVLFIQIHLHDTTQDHVDSRFIRRQR